MLQAGCLNAVRDKKRAVLSDPELPSLGTADLAYASGR